MEICTQAPVPDAESRTSCVIVRPATAADIPFITAIYARFVIATTATSEITVPDEIEMLQRWSLAQKHDLPYIVAELEGYVVGYCYVSQFRPREGYRHTVEDSIYVRPDCIGHGVGKLLLGELIERCRTLGHHSMVACIIGFNPASVALHTSLGFERAGVLPDAVNKGGEWLPMQIMQYLL